MDADYRKLWKLLIDKNINANPNKLTHTDGNNAPPQSDFPAPPINKINPTNPIIPFISSSFIVGGC